MYFSWNRIRLCFMSPSRFRTIWSSIWPLTLAESKVLCLLSFLGKLSNFTHLIISNHLQLLWAIGESFPPGANRCFIIVFNNLIFNFRCIYSLWEYSWILDTSRLLFAYITHVHSRKLILLIFTLSHQVLDNILRLFRQDGLKATHFFGVNFISSDRINLWNQFGRNVWHTLSDNLFNSQCWQLFDKSVFIKCLPY